MSELSDEESAGCYKQIIPRFIKVTLHKPNKRNTHLIKDPHHIVYLMSRNGNNINADANFYPHFNITVLTVPVASNNDDAACSLQSNLSFE